jgi:hypothetical protein
MRTILAILVIAMIGGCAGSQTTQRQSGPPVIVEQPKLSEKMREKKRQDAEQNPAAVTRADGQIVR